AYVAELRALARSLGISDVRMEEGSLRCDVNVSLSPVGSDEWGTRSETKNVNSLRSVERAVRSEIERQAGVLDAGGRVVQETRHFKEDTGTSVSGRSKEEAQDYRYFPDPDLVPVAPSAEWVEELRAALPEPPSVRRARIKAESSLTDEELRDLINADAVDLVEDTVATGAARRSHRAALVAQRPDQGRVVADRRGAARPDQRRRRRPGRGDRRGGRRAGRRAQLVAERALPAGHRVRGGAGRAADLSGAGG